MKATEVPMSTIAAYHPLIAFSKRRLATGRRILGAVRHLVGRREILQNPKYY